MQIAVCCSSSDEIDKKYLESSSKLLDPIFKEKNDLVFGAYNKGIMGIAYKTAKKHNRNIFGSATELYKKDLKDLDCNIKNLAKGVNARTEVLIDTADILLFLPGGIGTIYELLTAIEMKRNKEYNKPIIIYNKTGFFDKILGVLEQIYEEKFSSETIKSNYNVVNNIEDVLKLMDNISRKKEKV